MQERVRSMPISILTELLKAKRAGSMAAVTGFFCGYNGYVSTSQKYVFKILLRPPSMVPHRPTNSPHGAKGETKRLVLPKKNQITSDHTTCIATL